MYRTECFGDPAVALPVPATIGRLAELLDCLRRRIVVDAPLLKAFGASYETMFT